MPLVRSTSKSARQKNIRTETDAGKPVQQAVAIGYSEQREARKSGSRSRAERVEHKAHLDRWATNG